MIVVNPRRAFLLSLMATLAAPEYEIDADKAQRFGQLSDGQATIVMMELITVLLDHPLRSVGGARKILGRVNG